MSENKKITSFTDLHAWQKGHDLVKDIYEITADFPQSEQFGLTGQMRRCAVSITSNIAEGFSRRTRKDKNNFYTTAHGSVTELQNQLIVARDVGFLSSEKFDELADDSITVHKLITGLTKSAETKNT